MLGQKKLHAFAHEVGLGLTCLVFKFLECREVPVRDPSSHNGRASGASFADARPTATNELVDSFLAGTVDSELHNYFDLSIGLRVLRPDEEPVNRAITILDKVGDKGCMSDSPTNDSSRDAVLTA